MCTLQSDPSCPLSVVVHVTPLAVIQTYHSRNWSPLGGRINNDILFCVWQTYDLLIFMTVLLILAYCFHVNNANNKSKKNAIP